MENSPTNAQRLAQISEGYLKGLDGHIAQLTQQLQPTDPPGDGVQRELRAREIRDLLREKSELEVKALYLELGASGKDDETMAAIEDSPLAFPLLSEPEVIEESRWLRSQRQRPALAKELQQLKVLRSQIEAAANTARAELNLPDDDVTSRLATSGAT